MNKKIKHDVLAQHCSNQKTPLFPPFARGDTGGCKKTFQKKKFFQSNTLVRLLLGLPFISCAIVFQINADNRRDYFKSASQCADTMQPPLVSPSSQYEREKAGENGGSHNSQNTANDTVPPVVHTDLKPAIVNDQNLFFSIESHDNEGVDRLYVNQQPLEICPGKHVFFNHLITLNEGENTITIKAVDTRGNETQLYPIKITKKTFDLLETDNLYTVALLPLRVLAQHNISSDVLYSLLLKAFDEEPKRFNLVERDPAKLEEILHEQKISNTELTSPEAAVKIGKIRAAEGVFFGSVEENDAGITITLRLVDTETTRILASASVHEKDRSLKNLEWLLYGLSLKMKGQFPMVRGNIISVSRNGFLFNAGAANGIRMGMKLLLFREIKEGDFVLKEPLDAVARVIRVRPTTAFARISAESTSRIEKRDLVMTK
ncbi:MAG: hypothetical protein E3K36_13645 [Candidatus Brocadia sp.]|nr:hypothetical protein [Candidatus Brocadia sp.]